MSQKVPDSAKGLVTNFQLFADQNLLKAVKFC